MNLHTLKNSSGARHVRKRLGRGEASGKGKTCGKGHKGQMARKGNKHKEGFEGGQMRLIRRVPKRGFHNQTQKLFAPVNVSELERFLDGAEVTVEMLRGAGLVKGRWTGVKILGNGDLSRKLSVKVHSFSEAAKAKIEAAGGSCEVMGK
ncbi:MAG: 50S ribosomal protein L15 [Lentisphaerae bacterium]|nr:50S ribosomal protein L15 [Lentisphaerota bacterium]